MARRASGRVWMIARIRDLVMWFIAQYIVLCNGCGVWVGKRYIGKENRAMPVLPKI
jgi:hypothetical protein